MVIFKNTSRFYSRNSAGKFQLDVDEIRAAFALSDTIRERIQSFRTERLSSILADEAPVLLPEGGKLIFHIVPFTAFDVTKIVDISDLHDKTTKYEPLRSNGWNHRYNFDGFLTYSSYRDTGKSYTYLQVFRNGSIEAVLSLVHQADRAPTIPSTTIEAKLIGALPRFLQNQMELGVVPPLLLMLSFLDVKGYILGISQNFWGADIHPIDRDALIIPEVLLESFDVDAAKVLQPTFNALWNAAGVSRSLNYDSQGNWNPP